jgi:hypothetical protein
MASLHFGLLYNAYTFCMLCEYETLSPVSKIRDGHTLPFPGLEFQDAFLVKFLTPTNYAEITFQI